MLDFEVLVRKFLAVNGLSTGALARGLVLVKSDRVTTRPSTYVTTSEVTALEHKVGDDTVELGVLVAVTF